MPIRPIISSLILWLHIWPIFLRPFVARLPPMDEGDFDHPFSVSLGREGFNVNINIRVSSEGFMVK